MCAAVPPGAAVTPEQVCVLGARWYPATVPGTAASAVRAAEGAAAAVARDYDAEDWWFVATLGADNPDGDHAAPCTLTAHGLATVAEIWVDGRVLARSESMFTTTTVQIDALGPRSTVALRFCALTPLLAQRRRPRARWRSALVREQGLRWWRTSLLGRAPVYTGTAAPVGPFRAIELCPQEPVAVVHKELSTALRGSTGELHLAARLRLRDPATEYVAKVSLGALSVTVALERDGVDFLLLADVEVIDVALWWPHTHGEQPLYPLTVTVAGACLDWGSVGFREVHLDRSNNGFAISVNGVEIFCRGACWTPLDPVGLVPDLAEIRATLGRARDAGLNMVRVTGTMLYEDAEFWKLCAELGLLVWQDAMLATLDPPDEPQFNELLDSEIEKLCTAVQGNPALAVFSGGSETEQQPAFLGLPAERRTITAVRQRIPETVARLLPGTPYVSSSPSGGALPTHVGTGVSHYFGVGAYLQPLSGIRTSGVRFAAECLAFAVPPERRAVERHFGSAAMAGHHPRWKAAVPRDNGSAWDFEDVRDYYVRTLFGVDPLMERRVDPERYLDLGRAAVCEAVAAGFGYWRRPGSGCGGALMLSLRDLECGAGWGLLDAEGTPKAPYFVLRRLCRPVALTIADEGLDGIRIDLYNDRPERLEATMVLTAYSRWGNGSTLAETSVAVDGRSSSCWLVDELAGGFLDLGHAYKFGPQAYDVLSVQVVGADGVAMVDAVQLLGEQARPPESDVGLSATVSAATGNCWTLVVGTRYTAQYVSVDIDGYQPDDSWFHLAAGTQRSVHLQPRCPVATAPQHPVGYVRALNSLRAASVVRKR